MLHINELNKIIKYFKLNNPVISPSMPGQLFIYDQKTTIAINQTFTRFYELVCNHDSNQIYLYNRITKEIKKKNKESLYDVDPVIYY